MAHNREEISSLVLYLFLEAKTKGVSGEDLINIIDSQYGTDGIENSSKPESA